MRVLRFMSVNEVILLLEGRSQKDTLINTVSHKAAGNATNSVGFCFLMPRRTMSDNDAMFNAARFLSGIATMDVCLIAELKAPSQRGFKQTWGQYRAGRKKELCVTQYGLGIFEDWKLYAPNDRYLFLPTASPNWIDPRYVTQKESW